MAHFLIPTLICLVLAWGVGKCIAISRRPATNTFATVGLACVLACWLVALAAAALARGQAVLPRVLGALGAVFALGLMAAGFVLAIIGLVQIYRKRTAYTQGLRQAWSGVAICALFFVGFFVAAIVGIAQNVPRAMTDAKVFEEMNFRVEAPPRGWAAIRPGTLNEDASLALVHKRSGVWFIVIAEAVGVANAWSTEELADVVESMTAASGTNHRRLDRVAYEVDGVPGILTTTEMRLGAQEITYVKWVTSLHGYQYQLVAWGSSRQGLSSIRSSADEIFQAFRLIDRDRFAAGPSTLTDHTSGRYGYTMLLADSGFTTWEDLATDAPAADLGGFLGPKVAFVVSAASLQGHNPESAAFASAMIGSQGIIDESSCRSVAGKSWGTGFEDTAFRCNATIDDERFDYDVHVIRGDHYGYVVNIWTVGKLDDRDQLIDDLLARFRPLADHPPPEDDTELSPAERDFHAGVFLSLGLDHFTAGRFASATRYFETANRLAPDEVTIVTHLVRSLSFAERYREGLEVLARYENRFPEDLDLWSYRPYLLARLGDDAEAVDAYEPLFAAGYVNDEDFSIYLEALGRLGRQERALREAEEYHARHDSVGSARLLSSALGEAGQHDRAIEILRGRQAEAPRLESLAVDLVLAYENGGRHVEAIEVAEQWIDGMEQPGTMHFLKGRNEVALERYREAKRSFEQVLELNPSDAASREYLQMVSGMLGQGDNTVLKQPIDPVTLPDFPPGKAIRELTDEQREFGAVVLSRARAISYRKSEEWRETRYLRLKILDRGSLSRFASLHERFDPIGEQLYINKLEVRDEDDNVVAIGMVDDYYVVDENASGMATYDKVATLPVPGLEVGTTIELVATTLRKAPPDRFPFVRHDLFGNIPVLENVVTISGDVHDLSFRSSHIPEPSRDEQRLTWRVEDAPIFRPEPWGAPTETYLPTLWVTDRESTWENVVNEYLEDLRPRLETVAEIDSIARDRGGLASLARYVQDGFTYQAIEFGPRGRIPPPVSETLANRYGDCKDHALLLHLLMRSDGIPSFLALVNTGATIQEETPSLDQFNHMIVYAPEHRAGHFLDATDKGHDITALAPMSLGGTRALILDPDRPRFVSIGEYGPESSVIRSERRIRIVDGGHADVEETLRLGGYAGAFSRLHLAGGDAIGHLRWIQGQLSLQQPTPEVSDVSIDGLEDLDQPLVIRLRYGIPGAFRDAEGHMSGNLPAVWEHTYLGISAVLRRSSPFRTDYPIRFDSVATLEIPDGYVRDDGMSLAEQANESRWARWSVRPSESDGTLRFEYSHHRASAAGSAEEYAEFQQGQAEGLNALSRSIALHR